MALREELRSQGNFLFKYRSYLPLGLLVFGIALKLWMVYESIGTEQFWLLKIMENIGIVVSLVGLGIRSHTIGYASKNTSGRNTSHGQVADSLNTTGLYSITRNPLYLGNYLMWLGIAMFTGSFWFVLVFSLIFWLYYERIIFAEEEFLRDKFGAQYLNWADKISPFIPFKLKWVKSGLPFSWKKVIKQEKNGLLALFLVFYILEFFSESVAQQKFVFEQTWLFIMTIVSGVTYVLIKLLDKNTSILDESDR